LEEAEVVMRKLRRERPETTFGPTATTGDGARIRTQIDRVRIVMELSHQKDRWLTLWELRKRLEHKFYGCVFPEASISADLRHLKKSRFGKHDVQKRRRKLYDTKGKEAGGLWEYRMFPSNPPDFLPGLEFAPFEATTRS
jgi:hypothetical protein